MALVLGVAVVASAQTAPRRSPYDESANARADIVKAVTQGRADHKRILLVFGANW